MSITNESEVESHCINIFTNLGWDVEREKIVEGINFRPDITLSYNGQTCGFVEIVADMSIEIIKRKKDLMTSFLDEVKPRLFVLTNGESFDIFYNGKYATTQTVPPSPEGMSAMGRIMMYYEKLQEVMKKDE